MVNVKYDYSIYGEGLERIILLRYALQFKYYTVSVVSSAFASHPLLRKLDTEAEIFVFSIFGHFHQIGVTTCSRVHSLSPHRIFIGQLSK